MEREKIVQSIERALSVLEELAKEGGELGVTELAQRLKLNKSTVHRLLSVLLKFNYVDKDPQTKKYRLGMKPLYLGGVILDRLDLRREAHELLKRLAAEVNETVHLVIPDNYMALYIDKIDSNQTFRMRSQIGWYVPLHATAVGKVILAFSSREYLEKVIEKGLQACTPNTITDPKKLIEHLKEVRRLGYAVDNEENEPGVRCVAAPIFDYKNKVIAALGISGSVLTVTPERVPFLAGKAKEYALEVSRRMGWRGY